MHKTRAILFDLDNTLIDFIQMKEESCKAAVQAMISAGLDMNKKEAYSKLMKTYFKLGLESDVAFTHFLKETGNFDHKILAAAINTYLETKTKHIVPYPNVKAVLQELKEKGLVIAILTDAPKTKAYQRLLIMEIEHYFNFVIGFEDTNLKKYTGLPLKLGIEILKKQLPGILNCEVLMVGDSIKRDLIPTKLLGLKTAIAKYGQTEAEKGKVDYELETIGDLIKIV
ncbi:MAG: HAD hydrolase-like protein [Candidatus Lokiarchaeota archaeon]|nr:HAD hydrolase-like protein [Candidatus Lokiarchaeota archaeon]